jgi:hypothetical protein
MLPSFGGGRNVIAGGARKPSSVITEIQSPAPDGGTPGSTASKTFSPLQKKRKLDVDNTNAPSERFKCYVHIYIITTLFLVTISDYSAAHPRKSPRQRARKRAGTRRPETRL